MLQTLPQCRCFGYRSTTIACSPPCAVSSPGVTTFIWLCAYPCRPLRLTVTHAGSFGVLLLLRRHTGGAAFGLAALMAGMLLLCSVAARPPRMHSAGASKDSGEWLTKCCLRQQAQGCRSCYVWLSCMPHASNQFSQLLVNCYVYSYDHSTDRASHRIENHPN
jgi:hypothetical protein